MIPIQNLYYVLCYAWNRLDEGELLSVPLAELATPQDLFARVLLHGSRRVLKDGLDRGYIPDYEEAARLRGRIDFPRSIGRVLFPRGRAGVHFDELSHNILHNQILKSTLAVLVSAPRLDKEIASEVRGVLQRLGDVDVIRVERRHFSRLQLHRNNAFYAFLMNVCEVVWSMVLPGEGGGETRFREFIRDEERMHTVFQDFVFNFFRIEQSDFVVRAQKLKWDGFGLDEEAERFLPEMITDVTLESPSRKIVVDTKYYSEAFQENFGKKSVRSGHLFQIYSYVENSASPSDAPAAPVEGVLIYPATADEFDLRYKLKGHPIRVMAVDLRRSWGDIAGRLLGIMDPPKGGLGIGATFAPSSI